jgi:anti-sigma-K factor RskA
MTEDPPTDAAGEYALGLLDGEDFRAARQRALTDPGFAAQVARWRGRLSPLVEEVPEVEPPSSAWRRIERSLGVAAGDNVVILRRRINVWRAATAAITAVAASLALVVFTRGIPQRTEPAAQPMVAMIQAADQVAAVASWDKSSRRLLVSEVHMPVSPRHDYQLWLIPVGGKPHSLGVMPARPHMQLVLAEPIGAFIGRGATLAVSLEPAGGSPTDQPSGPVVASGAMTTA